LCGKKMRRIKADVCDVRNSVGMEEAERDRWYVNAHERRAAPRQF